MGGRAFTFVILACYALRCASYAWTGHYGPAMYWASAMAITVSAEFLIPRWP